MARDTLFRISVSKTTVVYGCLFMFFIGLTGWIYTFALPGNLYFDDTPNLEPLAEVNDFTSAMRFVSQGVAGPTGRPLSLLTFAMQATSWNENIGNFLTLNITIHLINGLLVFFCALLLAKSIRPEASKNTILFSLAVSIFWVASPFLSSSVLMIIQRMTLLAGMFMFLGIILFLIGRRACETKPGLGITLMVAGAGGGTLLGTLSKENAALLPLLLLCIELLFLRIWLPISSKRIRAFVFMLLALPSLCIVAYIGYIGLNGSTYVLRDFTLRERLLTQPRVIWDYVYNLLLPAQHNVTPFTDSFKHSTGLTSPRTTWLAMSGVVGMLALCIYLTRYSIIPLFGITFFLLGQLMESSVIGLELYFAHRAYVPAFGLFFALLYPVVFNNWSKNLNSTIKAGVIGYLGITFLVLASTTSTWGKPDLAAELWYMRNEDSPRAAQFLAQQYLNEGDSLGAEKTIRRTLEYYPKDVFLHIQHATFCPLEESDYLERLAAIETALNESEKIRFFVVDGLRRLAFYSSDAVCPHATPERLLPIVLSLIDRQDDMVNDYTRHHLAYTLAVLSNALGDTEQTINYLKKAFELARMPSTATLIAFNYLSMSEPGLAEEFLLDALKTPPDGFFEARIYIQEIQDYLEKLKDWDNTEPSEAD